MTQFSPGLVEVLQDSIHFHIYDRAKTEDVVEVLEGLGERGFEVIRIEPLEQIVDALEVIRAIVSQAWFALDDSEDRREDGYHSVPNENVDALQAALERARELIPDDGEPDYPHHLVDILIGNLNQARGKA